jgi:uncharacterized protein DUF1761
MMPNLLALLLAALSTLVVGFVWYNPKVFGGIWMRETGMTEEKAKGANMVLIFGMSVIYAFLIAFTLQFIVIHQWGVFSLFGGDVTNEGFKAVMTEENMNAFRTFKHGMLHGFLTGLLFAIPIIGTNSLYEGRSWKYTLVTGGFWVVCCTIMGGIICAMK